MKRALIVSVGIVVACVGKRDIVQTSDSFALNEFSYQLDITPQNSTCDSLVGWPPEVLSEVVVCRKAVRDTAITLVTSSRLGTVMIRKSWPETMAGRLQALEDSLTGLFGNPTITCPEPRPWVPALSWQREKYFILFERSDSVVAISRSAGQSYSAPCPYVEIH